LNVVTVVQQHILDHENDCTRCVDSWLKSDPRLKCLKGYVLNTVYKRFSSTRDQKLTNTNVILKSLLNNDVPN
jgi:hypothetical protein